MTAQASAPRLSRRGAASTSVGRLADRRWRERALLVLLVGLAFALRLADLTKQSLWPDEIYSLVTSSWTWSELTSRLVQDHVPLYPLLLGGWRDLTGPSTFSLRYFSLLSSTLSVPLAAALARRLLPRSAVWAAVLLLAISPFQVYYAQETVLYALLGFLALLSSWVLLRWAARPTPTILLGQALLYAALAYTAYGGLFVLAAHGAIVVSNWLSRWWTAGRRAPEGAEVGPDVGLAWSRRWLVSLAGGGLLFLPWLASHPRAVQDNLVGGTSRPLLDLLGVTFTDLNFGPQFTAHLDAGVPAEAMLLRNLAWASLLLPLTLVLALLPPRRSEPGRPEARLVLALQALVPFAILLALVQFSRDFNTRYAFPAAAWFPLLAAAGLWRLSWPGRSLGLALLVLASGWGGLIYADHPGFARLDFRDAIAEIVQQRAPGDAVIVTAPYLASTFDYYAGAAGPTLPRTPLPAAVPMNQSATLTTLARLAAVHPRLWVLRWQDDYADPHGVIPGWLAAHGGIHDVADGFPGNLGVDRWLTRPPLVSALPPAATAYDGRLGGAALAGYRLQRVGATSLVVTLYWRLAVPLTGDYTIFLHLNDAAGRRVMQADAQPYDGQYPTSHWPVGPLVRDTHRLTLAACQPAGRYSLDLGMYLLQTMQRLGGPGQDTLRVPLTLAPPPLNPLANTLLWRLPAPLRLDDQLPVAMRYRC